MRQEGKREGETGRQPGFKKKKGGGRVFVCVYPPPPPLLLQLYTRNMQHVGLVHWQNEELAIKELFIPLPPTQGL